MVEVTDYTIREDLDGIRTIFIETVPDFDPEPFGPVPSDDDARLYMPLCEMLVANSWDALVEEAIDFVQIRSKFTPSTADADLPENITFFRFHDMLYGLTEDGQCLPNPLGAGRNNLSPQLPSGVEVRLAFAESSPTPRQLVLSYVTERQLDEISAESLASAAMELCILHADIFLADRTQYYPQIETETIMIAFTAGRDVQGRALAIDFVFDVNDGRCDTGLSAQMSEIIRTTSEAVAL